MKHLNGQKILLGLSGGINSAAVLCHLKESGIKPAELHLFHSGFTEHSPDTYRFVFDCVRFARKHFDNVHFRLERNSVLKFFEQQNMIPHPMSSPCSRILKIQRMTQYAFENGLTIDLVGYVKHELKRRSDNQQRKISNDLFSLDKQYPIGAFDDEWCFEIVERNIGWFPKLYTHKWNDPDFMAWVRANKDLWPPEIAQYILKRLGKDARIFKHNNCLPCKNMYPWEIVVIEFFYPEYFRDAMLLSDRLKKYFGRDKDLFYATFGRELGQESTCGNCAW